MDKKEIRKDALESRSKLADIEIAQKSVSVMRKISKMNKFASSNIIMCYMDFKNEVVTRNFIKSCLNSGKRIAVPVVVKLPGGGRKIIASEIHDMEKDLETGTFGILEPARNRIREIKPDAIDMIIVPGVAFDEKLNRIGYGAGFYDRFLRDTREDCLKIGVAFDMQVYREVPAESHDIPVDVLVTEKRVIAKTRINMPERIY